ncbi:response regulator [Coraliomargarita sinensis]|uniref:response regulator n=1 Tax=Coraliomargarita sinensis TaxID=2174842 RepID=UPI0018EEC1D7|nr:response regulator transcription factor [Coraliomargarita sinensis]
MKTTIKVILAEDHLIVREGIRRLLEEAGDFIVVAEAESGREAVSQVARLHPDVVVMDIAMPLLNGLDACRQLLASDPIIRVLILSAHMDDAYVEGAIDAGAAGFTLKHAPGHELAHAIREVHAGRFFFNESILRRSRTLQTGLPDEACPKNRARLSPGKRKCSNWSQKARRTKKPPMN